MNTKLAFKSQEGKKEILKIYDSLIERWHSPNEKFYVNTSFGSTFVIASGEKDAPPLILLHGSAMNSAMWANDVKQYSRNYRVYAVDMPGEPGRSDENQLPFNGSNFSDWLDDVFKALSLKSAVLIGISLGAWVAVKFSVNHPEKVDKLVLLCPAGIGPQKKSFLFKSLAHMLLGERGMKKLYNKVNGNQPIPEVILNYQMLIGKNFNYRREVIPLFRDSELKQLTMPTILFVGGKDIMIHSLKTAHRLKNLVPHAKINIIPDSGHVLINLTNNIIDFIENQER